MRKMMGIAAVAALAFTAGVALADEATGKIEKIDLSTNTFTIGDQTFQWSSDNSLGPKLKELKEGDEVKVMYEPNQSGNPDVMEIMKAK